MAPDCKELCATLLDVELEPFTGLTPLTAGSNLTPPALEKLREKQRGKQLHTVS